MLWPGHAIIVCWTWTIRMVLGGGVPQVHDFKAIATDAHVWLPLAAKVGVMAVAVGCTRY